MNNMKSATSCVQMMKLCTPPFPCFLQQPHWLYRFTLCPYEGALVPQAAISIEHTFDLHSI